ncbi:hypothetical protein BCR35DRAFT_298758 [Leucosporidium creatinivorum]|uniref:Uncharacterized protein n=1 Tax=Leucosporidium creatinivorum TaxID=106004 RepID=A0A1Y2G436_9BASI|nr:hypothetical protein BCR35DRAFT_298758 [Leucosporidium creatinivorum]
MNQSRPNLGRRSSLGGPGGLVRSPSSTLLSAQNPAESLLSTPHAYSRAPPQPSTAFQHLPTITTRTPRTRPLPISPTPHVEGPTAAAWAGGTTTTLQFAIRAGDRDLIRQERARLARLGINPESEEERSSDDSDRSFGIPVKDTRLPPYNNHRRTSLASYTGNNPGYPNEPRGRSSANRPSSSQVARPPSPAGRHSFGGGGSYAREPSPNRFASGMVRGASPARGLPSPSSLGAGGGSGGAIGISSLRRSTSRDRLSGAGSTPGASAGGKLGGLTSSTIPQPMSSLSRRASSPARPSRSLGGGPVIQRGFDVPGGSPSGQARAASPAGRRFGFGSPSMGGETTQSRVARGRAGSIAGLGAGAGSPPTAEAEVQASRDLEDLGRRRRLTMEERRAIESRIARGYRSP